MSNLQDIDCLTTEKFHRPWGWYSTIHGNDYNGYKVKMVSTNYESYSIDVDEDKKRVEKYYNPFLKEYELKTNLH